MSTASWRFSLQAWLALLGLGVSLWLVISYGALLLELVWILFGAFLLSLAIRPLADALARRHIPRGLTVLGVYLALLALLAGLGTLLVPVVSAEVNLLRANGPDLLQKALAQLAAIPGLGRWVPSLDSLTQSVVQYTTTLFPTVLSTVAGVGEITINLLVVLVLAYFFAADASLGSRLLQNLMPKVYQPQAVDFVSRLRFRLTRWVWAQLAIAVYFAVAYGIGASLLGVPFASTIALVGGVLEIIPYVGGVVAMTLGVLSALTVTPWLAVWLFVLYLVIAQVQSHIVAPAFYGRAMDLHPAAVLIALLIGAKTLGLLGVFFAVPVTVVLLTFLSDFRQTNSAESPRAK